jgi:hypothetical protein
MTVLAKTIIAEAQRAMNDKIGTRMPASDLVPLLNRAQRDIALARPDSTASLFEFTAAGGWKQSLPATAATLVDIPSNATGMKRSISRVDQALLDSSDPRWRSGTQKSEAYHYCQDPRNPRQFLVYPPVVAGTKLDMEASLYPVDIPDPVSPGESSDTVVGNISLADEWGTALLMVTLYYAYLTDVEALANVGLAAGYKQTAEQILGVQLQSAVTAAKPE